MEIFLPVIGPFAIEKGLVKAEDGVTTVRIYNTNTDKIIAADVTTSNGEGGLLR